MSSDTRIRLMGVAMGALEFSSKLQPVIPKRQLTPAQKV